MSKEPKRIQSVERSFLILEALSSRAEPLSLQDVTQAVGLNKTTVHGLLATMSQLGYVSRDKQGYSLGLRLRELYKPVEQRDEVIRRRFSSLLTEMARLSDNTAYLAVLSGSQEYLYLDAIEGGQSLTMRSPRGSREGLTTSAIGKVFLSFDEALRRRLRLQNKITKALEQELELIASQGYGLDLEQAQQGLNCLAIPLYLNGKLVAVAGMSGSAKDLPQTRLIRFAAIFLNL